MPWLINAYMEVRLIKSTFTDEGSAKNELAKFILSSQRLSMFTDDQLIEKMKHEAHEKELMKQYENNMKHEKERRKN